MFLKNYYEKSARQTEHRQHSLRECIGIAYSLLCRGSILLLLELLFGSGLIEKLRLRGKYIDHRLVTRPEPGKAFGSAFELLSRESNGH